MRVQAEANIGTVVVSDRNDDRIRLQGVVEENVQGGINDRLGVRMRNYDHYIAGKIKTQVPSGFTPDHDLTDALFDWQWRVVKWALTQGRAALFEECGLGKTLQQLVWAREVAEYTGKPVLILCPLAVASQTIREAAKFRLPEVRFVEAHHEITDSGVFISNYEKLEHIEESIPRLGGVVLDESSILKSFTGKTRAALTGKFSRTPFRLCCTATPSPNDFTELGNHSEFLGAKTRVEMLSEYFVHDGGSTADWRLKGHAVEAFWEWIATWGAFVKRPSDLGYSDEGFDLPPLTVDTLTIGVDHEDAQKMGRLFADNVRTLNDARATRRATMSKRVSAAVELTCGDEPAIVWCELNEEAEACAAAIEGAINVQGSDDADVKIERLLGFAHGKYRVLVTKAKIAGAGMNFQRCARMVFLGASHSYEQTYQSIRRCWRFGQTRPVNVTIIMAETEGGILENYRRKEAEAEKLSAQMTARIADYVRRDVAGMNPPRWNAYKPTKEMELPSWM